MNFLDLANLLDNDGNMQNEMMVMAFAATLLSTIPVLLGNEFDINVGLKKKRKKREILIQVYQIDLSHSRLCGNTNYQITLCHNFLILQDMWKNIEKFISISSSSMPLLDPIKDSLFHDVDANKTKSSYNQHALNDANTAFLNDKMNVQEGTDNRLVVLKGVHDDEEIGTSM